VTVHGRHIEIRGVVQGVGFRPWVYQLARVNGLTGRVWNDSTGVMIDAFGDDVRLALFLDQLSQQAPPAARVREIEWSVIPYETLDGFGIIESAESAARRVTIPPDLAVCDPCLAEVFDPTDRRYRYPFTNCTNCGPRYSIVRGVPYDRAKTTMASFTMCDACRAEYENPLDRRFHAQPNACPVCGPKLSALTPEGREIDTANVIGFAARAIRAGLTVAIKGLGGFHLACDATSPQAVQRLRARKRREAKPLAVMVRDLAAAEKLAELTDVERELLMSVERPIVLASQHPNIPTSQPDNPLIGLFLPYTPMHHLLVRDCGKPLIMTSGNVTDEPMAISNRAALEQLRDIADLFIVHDREIETRVDDSVARVIDGAPTILRRARGYVPRGIEIDGAFDEPILAAGADLKNTFCIGSGNAAFLGPHIGDLESVETLRSFEAAVVGVKEFVGVDPRVIAHDLHPEYFSTRYALAQQGVQTIGVQHHHAHIAAAMAEHRLRDSVIGVAYDGTGWGTDGTAWGGEILIANYASYERFATFRPIALAGGDQAIRQPWRIALALLDDAFDGEPPLHAIPLFRPMHFRAIDAIRRMIQRGLNAVPARGVGRYFDAFGAFAMAHPDARYEGEVAFRWNMIADPAEQGRYPYELNFEFRISNEESGNRGGLLHSKFEIRNSKFTQVDLRPAVRQAVDDLIAGTSPSVISARFHNTLAAVTVEVVRAALEVKGEMAVVFGGGCFQNARLAESIANPLRDGGARVFMNHDVPPGDGGIALGQAFVANAQLRAARVESVPEEVPVCV
jgi:hydrogenase maturation protein HypF